MKEAITVHHLMANILDTRFMGKRISVQDEQQVEEFVKNKKPNWLPFLMAFAIKDECFPSSMFASEVIEKLPGSRWWIVMKKKNDKAHVIPDDFINYTINLLNCPASSASIERIFSTYGLVWTDLRNRLGVEKAQKLVQINRFLNNKK